MKRILILMGMLLFVSTTLFGQTIRVTGTVTSEADRATLPGVSIMVRGTAVGTVTDVNGRFEITVAPNAVLVFSFIGMEGQEVNVDGRNVINIQMISEAVGLEEVMVIAYGTARRESFTGVANVVSGETIQRRAVANVTRALEGTTPGMQVTSGGGQPGAGAGVRLRGFGSISADNAPLYVVDGMPFEGSLNAINPNDIASITVLRDAAAAALFGARGANGVVMITTRRGDPDRPVMSFSSTLGFTNRVIPEYPRVNSADYMLLTWEALRNSFQFRATSPLTTAAANVEARDLLPLTIGFYRPFRVPAGQELIMWDAANPWIGWINPNAELLYEDDWQDHLFSTALRQDYQFSVSGGSERSDYFLSFGYLNEEGMAVNSSFERFSGRLNANTRPTDWFETGLNLNVSFSETFQQPFTGTEFSNAFYWSRIIPPIFPVHVRDNDGNHILDENGNKILDYGLGLGPHILPADPLFRNRPFAANANVVGTLVLDDRSFTRENLNARTYALFHIFEGLTFRSNLSMDYYSLYQTTFQNPQFGDAANVQGRGTKVHDRMIGITANQLLNFNRRFGRHNVDFLLGHEAYMMTFNTMSATRTTFAVPGITEIGIATTTTAASSRQDGYALEGYFTRLTYDFDNRYYFSASYRRDGTSRFHADYRWGDFYSLGLSWRVSEERFMQNIDWLTNLRVRASYGQQGNDRIGTFYAWQELYALGWNNGVRPGAIFGSHDSRNLVWESSNNTNIGVDFTLFDRFSAEIDYFVRESSNLLFDLPLPPSTGVLSVRRNIGAMENRGIEARLMADVFRTDNFRWNIDFNITHMRNEITRMPDETPTIISGVHRLEVGRSMFDYFLRRTSRIDPATGVQFYFYDRPIPGQPGQFELRDTALVAQATRYYGGSAMPDFFGGITNSFAVGSFDLSVLFTYSVGGYMYDGTFGSLIGGRLWAADYASAYHANTLNRWRQPGDQTGLPRLQGGNTNLFGSLTEDWLFDRSFLALKNITIGYTVPRRLMDRFGVTNFRVFLTGDNLFVWNNNQGMDPQHTFGGTTDFGYVPVRTFTLGLNLQF